MSAKRPSLRIRVMLLFAAIGAGSVAAIVAGLLLAAQRIGTSEADDALALAGAVAIATTVGLVVWGWFRIDERGVQLMDALARLMQTVAHAGSTGRRATDDASGDLGLLAPAAGELFEALADARKDLQTARAEAAADALAQKAQIDAVLRDLDEAVLILTREHRIVLYNRRAVDLLGPHGEIGLDRSLARLLGCSPIEETLERLERARRQDRGNGTARAASTVCGLLHGPDLFACRVVLVADHAGAGDQVRRYVLTLRNMTQQARAHAQRDRLLSEMVATARGAGDRIAGTLAELHACSPGAHALRQPIEDRLARESATLAERVAELATLHDELWTSSWPMDDIDAGDLLARIGQRLGDAMPPATHRDEPLHCEGTSIATVLAHLVRRLQEAGARQMSIDIEAGEGRTWVHLRWPGEPDVPTARALLPQWLSRPLPELPGGLDAARLLEHHRSAVAIETGEPGCRLSVALASGVRDAASTALANLGERPEFYDFRIDDRKLPADDAQRPLATLTCVAFDTETTGLEPARGDEIVQIAGVRIVNGRVLAGESFDTLVNPQRSVPAVSTAIHGITEAMLVDAPTPDVALGRFHAFAEDAVLIAHNAAFDMAFLRRPGRSARFDNAVLDTVLLSAWLHDHTGKHTLDDLAARFDVEIEDGVRHTAIGDALATARVFVKMLPLLEARGVRTVGDAHRVSQQMTRIRRQQAQYG